MDLARGLAAQGVRTTLATMGPSPTTGQREEARSIPGLELHTSEYRTEWMPGSWADVDDAGRWLLALADRACPDIVHLNGYTHAALPWNVPTLVVGHGNAISCQRAIRPGVALSADWEEYRRRVRRGLECASMVATSTTAAMNELEREFGPVSSARVIPTGRATTELSEGKKRHMILSAARCWDDSKNLGVLQQMTAQYDWPVYVAGDLPHARQPRTQGINFLGKLSPSALATWYSRAAIFALPARYDAFGISTLEAAISGCALVLADIPSLREQWDGAALFASPDDPAAFVRAVRKVADDSDLRTELAAAAVDRAKQYSVTAMICGYLFAYQDLKQTSGLDMAVLTHPGVSLL
jgi:glycosyltransferase involved in cell wall biosynthesis